MRVPVTARVGLALVVVCVASSTVMAYIGLHRVTKQSMRKAKPPFSLTVNEKDGVVRVAVDIPKDKADWLDSVFLTKEKGKKTVLSLSIAATVRDNGSAVVGLALPREVADGAELGINFKASPRADALSSSDIFTGKHSQKDAFLLVSGASEDLVPEKPSVSDVLAVLNRLREKNDN